MSLVLLMLYDSKNKTRKMLDSLPALVYTDCWVTWAVETARCAGRYSTQAELARLVTVQRQLGFLSLGVDRIWNSQAAPADQPVLRDNIDIRRWLYAKQTEPNRQTRVLR